MGLFQDVGEFHHKFDLPVARSGYGGVYFDYQLQQKPHLLGPRDQRFRENFLFEEVDEFVVAHEAGDLAKAADALADIVYVALGTAHLMGIPFDQVWAEVQRANMAKERASGPDDARSNRKHALDVVKPEGWVPPDVAGVLRMYGANI